MFTESLALSKRRLLNDGCRLTLLWQRNYDTINCGVLRRRTKKTGYLQIQENWLVPAAEKVGLGRIGWHTFRHSHSSLLHALGVDLKVQQELLRHADIRTTMNIYTHAVPAALRKANSKVVRLVLPAQVA